MGATVIPPQRAQWFSFARKSNDGHELKLEQPLSPPQEVALKPPPLRVQQKLRKLARNDLVIASRSFSRSRCPEV
jgi:hypothetical protein